MTDDARPPLDDGPSGGRARIVLLVAGLLALVVVAVGLVWFVVGGDDPTSGGGKKAATQTAFCKGLSGFQADFASIDPSTDLATYVKSLKRSAGELQAVGVPSNMPQDARDGYSLYLGEILALPDSATADDVGKLGSDTTAEEQGQLDALDTYIARECPALQQPG